MLNINKSLFNTSVVDIPELMCQLEIYFNVANLGRIILIVTAQVSMSGHYQYLKGFRPIVHNI